MQQGHFNVMMVLQSFHINKSEFEMAHAGFFRSTGRFFFFFFENNAMSTLKIFLFQLVQW